MTPALATCPRCQRPLPHALQGLCPGCLLGAAPQPPPELPEVATGTRLGDYLVGERVARGGMGVVFKARDERLHRDVALKMLLGGEFADEAERRRFEREARAAIALEHHPNIVPLYDVGEHAGAPYFTMRFIEGGTVADHLARFREDRAAACALMIAVARAVHYGHQHRVLHLDLKPSNVLLDREGTPYVADFGTARHLDDAGAASRTGSVAGTPAYMAPEQARGAGEAITTAADVYGLGAILYELLTGQPPFTGRSAEEVLDRVLRAEPRRPRELDPSIDRGLETICLKCLERDPEKRYASAFGLAADLERWLKGENLLAQPIGPLERAWRWARRNPVGAALVAAFVVSAPAALAMSQWEEARLVSDVLAANTYAARMAAGTTLFQLSRHREPLRQAAEDPRLLALLEADDGAGLRALPLGEGVRMPGDAPVASWSVQDPGGAARARTPPPPSGDAYFEGTFAFRDYFQGGLALGKAGRRTAYVSSAFLSEADGQLKFSMSTPLFGSGGQLLGVLGAHFSTDSDIEALRLERGADARRTAAVVMPWGAERSGDAHAGYVFLRHAGLELGRVMPFDPRSVPDFHRLALDARALDPWELPAADRVAASADYRDPLPGFEGRWLAGLAPVGNTGMFVVVQTRLEGRAPLQRFGLFFALPFALVLVLAAAARASTRRRL